MKIKNLLFAIIAIAILNLAFGALSCKAQTSVPAGAVSGIWTLAGSPYNVQGSISISNGTTLTIQPGVIINFQGHYKLNVQGRLIAVGTVTDTIIFTTANTSNGWGGIRFDHTPSTNDTSKIYYCSIQYGKANGSGNDSYGGGILLYSFSKVIIKCCNISNNVALSDGAGICCFDHSDPIIWNNVISYNSGAYWGGGIRCFQSNPSIYYNTISNNSAIRGGGIYFGGSSSSIVSNNIISNNLGTQGGGIHCFNYSNPTFINNIISNNSATNGGALFLSDDSDPIFINSVLWGNTATTAGLQVFFDAEGSDPDFYYCDVQGGSTAFELNGFSYSGTYQNNMDTDPKFVSPSSGSSTGFNGVTADWSLQNNSPCINTGDLNGPYPATDIAGNMRITVCRIDMGAYEFQNGIPFKATISQTQENLCYGDSTASATINVTGGTPTYTYLWSNGETSATASVLKAATYTVTVTETSFACSITKTITINEPAALSLIPSTTNPVCTNNNGNASITVSGGIAPYTYLWSTNNNSTTDTISSLLAGTYSVTDSNGCSILDSVTLVTQFPVVSIVSSITNPICTNNNGSAAITANGGTTPYTYLWSTNNNSTTDTISSLLAGTYSVTVTDTNGCNVLDSVTLVTQFPSLSVVSSFANASCYNNDGSTSVIPNGGAEPYSYLWSNNSISQNLSNIGSGIYSVTATDTNGCVVSETFIINNSIAPISIPICMVTVDSSSTKNVIVWEKPTDAPIDSFRIYREIASVYTFVGSVPYDEVSEFTDNANGINPNTTSYKYKLSVLDTCGNESSLSDIHRTIHVQISAAVPQGVNLNWNDYIGFTFSQYRILRDDLGNGNWQVVDSVSFGTTTYTSPDVLPNAGYIVEATRPTACVSTRQSSTTRNSSKSNTASQTTGVNEVLNDLSLLISPNPSNGKFVIELSSSSISNNNKYSVKIYNVLGEQVYLSELKQLTHNEIDLSNVPKGIYFVNVYNGDKIYTRKIVKQ